MIVRPANTQISLGIRPVRSESSLCAEWIAKDPRFLQADSKDSDQTGRITQADLSLRWTHSHFVGFVMSWLTSFDIARHRKNPKLSDRLVWANSVDPDQTASAEV